jgi:hypothetical protein
LTVAGAGVKKTAIAVQHAFTESIGSVIRQA